ncbi:MAG: DUF3579 domain-containing protein [Burkholderiaceae bacterium]|jgi:hypothetical protein|nr:DUF3579 domain-containing protein [Burkholderiaceae bacterium]
MATTFSGSEVLIQGVTRDGRTFRPSDWAERLAGVMAQFRPGGAQAAAQGRHLQYSPWCVPKAVGGVKCVVVNTALKAHEPMAWDFVMNFAKDNNLQVVDACPSPDAPAANSTAPGIAAPPATTSAPAAPSSSPSP